MSALRDSIAKFAGKNAQVLGVSKDDLETQEKFAKSLTLPFPLGADPKGAMTTAYGVDNGKYASRTSIVIDGDGKVVKSVSDAEAIDPAAALDACPLHKAKK